ERIAVITNGIDRTPFDRPREPGRVRRELGFPAEAPVVAVFARLHPVKGIDYFLEAAASLLARFPAARFLVVGEGRVLRDGVAAVSPYRQALERQSARLARATRVGV